MFYIFYHNKKKGKKKTKNTQKRKTRSIWKAVRGQDQRLQKYRKHEWVSWLTKSQIILKKIKRWLLFKVKEVVIGQKQENGSSECGSWNTFTILWTGVLIYTMSRLSQMTLKAYSSMRWSRILHLGGTLSKRLVKVLLSIIPERLQHHRVLEIWGISEIWTLYFTGEEIETQSDKAPCPK